MAYAPNIINFPTLTAECHDTEARSLKKINDLMSQMNATLSAMGMPGGTSSAPTAYVYGTQYVLPAAADLLDISAYNPNDVDCWVFVMSTPAAAQAGQQGLFVVRIYGHNNAYYEALTKNVSFPNPVKTIAVSSSENSLAWNPNPIYLAIRHS